MLDASSSASPLSAYLAKLERRCTLSLPEREALLCLPANVQNFDAHRRIVKEGQKAVSSVFLLDGLVSRQKRIGAGLPRIVSLSFPGDAVDLQTLFFNRTDHALFAHVPTIIVAVPHAAIIGLCDRWPNIARALWHDTSVDCAISREWVVNMGHRRAFERVAAWLLEVEARLTAVGHAKDGVFQLPLTQLEISSALGLSLVHLARSLKALREQKWVETQGHEVRLLDKKALADNVSFDPSYLHLATSPAFMIEVTA